MKDEIVRGMVALLRRCAFVVLGLMLVLFCVVQFQQRWLRHRAERLHAEILALQLHPGNYADVQRLQREWGAYGHYDGSCTVHHCIYTISMADAYFTVLGGPRIEASGPKWLLDRIPQGRWWGMVSLTRLYRVLGGRPALVYVTVRVRDDRIWGADFQIGTYANPGEGRNEGYPYVVLASVDSGSRLLGHYLNPELLVRGYSTMHEMYCLGCEYVSGKITPSTSPAVIRRFNEFRFDCITRFFNCRHPADLAPALWATAEHDPLYGVSVDDDDDGYCKVSTPILAREANDIVLVEVISTDTHPVRPDEPGRTKELGHTARARVIKTVKNGRETPPGTEILFMAFSRSVRSGNAPESDFVRGQQYFVLYKHHRVDKFNPWHAVKPCHALPNTDASGAEVAAGVAMDASAGEPYDYQNEAYRE